MSGVSNLILLLDGLNALMVTQQRISAILNKAVAEGRDVTQAELDELAATNDALAERVKQEL
jgi:hypothetical protein